MYAGVGFPLLFTLIFVSIATPSYEAKGRLLPTSDAANMGVMGVLSGIFGQGGFGSIDGAPSSFLYAEILNSNTVLTSVMETEYEFLDGSKLIKGDLYDIFNWPREYESIEKMKEKVLSKMNLENGLITISAEAPFPELAQLIVNTWIKELDEFNKNIRITQASENLIYLNKRIDETREELEIVTDSLITYLNTNRGYPETASPIVRSRVERLELNKQVKEDIFIVLSKECEMAKLNKRKTTPVVSILDTAVLPSEKSGPKKIPVFIISLFFSFIIIGISISILEARYPTADDSVITYREIIHSLKKDWRDVVSVFRRKSE